jgi:hypothetical protein
MRAQDRIDKWEDRLAKINAAVNAATNAAAPPVSKRERSAIVKNPSRRTGRLQSSNWYEKAARSIGISDSRLPQACDEERGEFGS